jgi:hypothetical protein
VREIKRVDAASLIQFVSYSTGAATFRAEGHEVVDLGLPDDNGFVQTILVADSLIRDFKPALIIAHEEFAALVAAQLSGIPSIYIAAWLPPIGSVAAESLRYAQEILVIEHPGVFPPLPEFATRPTYVGPVMRKMKYTLEDRSRLRDELGIDRDALAILVVQGGGWNEATAPICETVLATYAAIDRASKYLYWLAGTDSPELQLRARGIPGIQILEYYTPVERLIVSCDVVITKGTHQITLDAASLGVPSISLSPGLNPIDDALVPRIHNNVALMANAVDSHVLLTYINAVTATPRRAPNGNALYSKRGAELAAGRIVEALRRLGQ